MTNVPPLVPPTDDPAAPVPPISAGPQSASEGEWKPARLIYLYSVLLLSVLGMVAGAIIVGTAVVHVIAPDTGHRDGLDRAASDSLKSVEMASISPAIFSTANRRRWERCVVQRGPKHVWTSITRSTALGHLTLPTRSRTS